MWPGRRRWMAALEAQNKTVTDPGLQAFFDWD
jgi:hypothetical protein